MDQYDRWLTTPPEPDVIGECDSCGADFYAGCEYVLDTYSDEWFCDDNCYIEKLRYEGGLVTDVYEVPDK